MRIACLLLTPVLAALAACDRAPDPAPDRPVAAPTQAPTTPEPPRPAETPTPTPTPRPAPDVAIVEADGDAVRAPRADGRRLPLAEILRIATAAVPGEVIEVDLDDDDDGPEYEIKVLTADGRTIDLEIDAITGAILDMDDD